MKNRRLSPHFTLAEMTKTDQTLTETEALAQHAPGVGVQANLGRVCLDVLEPLRAAVGVPVRVNSGYRTDRVNKAVGGSPRSAHTVGLAVDLCLPVFPAFAWAVEGCDGRSASWFAWLWLAQNAERLGLDQVIYYEHGTRPAPRWVHVGLAPRGRDPRAQLLFSTHPGAGYLNYPLVDALARARPR